VHRYLFHLHLRRKHKRSRKQAVTGVALVPHGLLKDQMKTKSLRLEEAAVVKPLEASAEEVAVEIQEIVSTASNLVTCPRIAQNLREKEVSVVALEVDAVAVPLEKAATWAEVQDLTSIEASSRVMEAGAALSSRAHPNLKLQCGVLHLILL